MKNLLFIGLGIHFINFQLYAIMSSFAIIVPFQWNLLIQRIFLAVTAASLIINGQKRAAAWKYGSEMQMSFSGSSPSVNREWLSGISNCTARGREVHPQAHKEWICGHPKKNLLATFPVLPHFFLCTHHTSKVSLSKIHQQYAAQYYAGLIAFNHVLKTEFNTDCMNVRVQPVWESLLETLFLLCISHLLPSI